jgi:hypothetical protein
MVIKSMINFELHGLMDCAVELAVTFRELLAPHFDVAKAIELLLAPAPSPRNTADVTLSVHMLGQLQVRMHKLQTEVHTLHAEMRDLRARVRQYELAATPPSKPGSIPIITDAKAALPLVLIRVIKSVPPRIRRILRKAIGERSTKAVLSWLFG